MWFELWVLSRCCLLENSNWNDRINEPFHFYIHTVICSQLKCVYCTMATPTQFIILDAWAGGDFFFAAMCYELSQAATIFIKFFFLVFFPWNSCVVTVPAMGPKSLRFCINFMEIVINDASTAWRLARILLLYMIYLSMRVFYSEFFDDDFQLKPKIVGKHPDKINTFYCRIYQLNILFPKCYWNIENDWKYWKWWKTIEITK